MATHVQSLITLSESIRLSEMAVVNSTFKTKEFYAAVASVQRKRFVNRAALAQAKKQLVKNELAIQLIDVLERTCKAGAEYHQRKEEKVDSSGLLALLAEAEKLEGRVA